MPIYTYKCIECLIITEKERTIADRNKPVLCECGNKAVKTVNQISLKGFDKYGRSKKI